jgi:predicted nuclease of predicted toxin-antitoxin system
MWALTGADDTLIWSRAAEQGFVLTTKDDDFSELSILRGAPPKLILIRLGNCRTAAIANLLLEEAPRIARFVADQEASLLELP